MDRAQDLRRLAITEDTDLGVTLAPALEADRANAPSPWWLGEAIGHADIAAACALRFTREAHPGLFDPARWPTLAAHADACEALSVFAEICQPLTVAMADEG